jgi:hypothetical protein
MNSLRIVTLFGAIVIAVVVYFAFIYQLGFPDGFISEQDRARRTLSYYVIATSIVTSVLVAFSIVKQPVTPKRWSIALCAFYALSLVAAFLFDRIWIAQLTGSGGG